MSKTKGAADVGRQATMTSVGTAKLSDVTGRKFIQRFFDFVESLKVGFGILRWDHQLKFIENVIGNANENANENGKSFFGTIGGDSAAERLAPAFQV